MENSAIFNNDTAQQILTVLTDVFGDIEEVEFVTAMEMSKFEEDDPLYRNHCYFHWTKKWIYSSLRIEQICGKFRALNLL